MGVLIVVLGAIALVMLLPLVAALVGIYNAFWAAKIWALLVVPVFNFPPLPLAGAVGIALTFMALRPRTIMSNNKSDDNKVTIFVLPLVAAPLTYAIAWVVAKILL